MRVRNPLHYQQTEYDCGPTTMMNAVSYLFKRDEIPPDIPKHIMLYCLDSYNEKGEFGKSGTSCLAMQFLSGWLCQFAKVKQFPISATYLSGPQVFAGPGSPIVAALEQGGAVVVRLMYGVWHYALITGVKGQNLYLFDPYYRIQPFKNPHIHLVGDAPGKHNRRITFDVLNSTGNTPYALGPVGTREAVLLFNESTRTKPVEAIEYFI